MVERTRGLDIVCHALLILGGLLVCVPIYFAFVVGSLHDRAKCMTVPLPWLPGDQFFANTATAWTKGNFGRLFLNSLIVAVGIAAGKIAVSLLSAFAITYFRFRFRMLAFWLIFMSLMLPVEVRIVPTYEAVANVALPLQWLRPLHVAISGNGSAGHDIDRMEHDEHLRRADPAADRLGDRDLPVPPVLPHRAGGTVRGGAASTAHRRCASSGASCCRCRCSNIVALAIILFLFGWNQYLWPLLFTTDKDMATAVIGLKNLIPQRRC